MGALAFALQAFEALPALIEAGVNVVSLVNQTTADLKKMQQEGRGPTDDEWDALDKTVEDLRAQRPDVSKEA